MTAFARIQEVFEALGLDLPPGAAERLLRLASLLRQRGPALGLISSGDADRVLERHVFDCVRAIVAVRPGDASAYDLGSGAGLPGLVVAVAVPHLAVALVEARRRRAAFLELAVEDLETSNATVLHARIESLQEPVDLCFARALAPLPRSWALARPLLREGGRLVYFAGSGLLSGDLPEAAEVRPVETPLLESSGPLVIMTR